MHVLIWMYIIFDILSIPAEVNDVKGWLSTHWGCQGRIQDACATAVAATSAAKSVAAAVADKRSTVLCLILPWWSGQVGFGDGTWWYCMYCQVTATLMELLTSWGRARLLCLAGWWVAKPARRGHSSHLSRLVSVILKCNIVSLNQFNEMCIWSLPFLLI